MANSLTVIKYVKVGTGPQERLAVRCEHNDIDVGDTVEIRRDGKWLRVVVDDIKRLPPGYWLYYVSL